MEVSREIDFLVAGHTHLERALKRSKGPGYYFNSGTWARLIRIDPAMRTDPIKFKSVFDTLKDGSMTKLDAHQGLVTKHCTVVAIFRNGENSAIGKLQHVKNNGTATALEDVPNTQFERSN